jgi:hypothetical protein
MNSATDRKRAAGGARAPKVLNWWRGLLMAMIAILTASGLVTRAPADDLQKSGTVTIEQYQVAFIGSGNLGGGKLTFEGKEYGFTIGGLGIGGFGVSKINAQGTVYNLKQLSDFEGVYGQARTGYAAADTGGGTLWMENTKGVYMKLATTREGLALSLGGDGVYIDLD